MSEEVSETITQSDVGTVHADELAGEAAPELTLDDLFSIQRDEDAIKQTEQELLIPVGTYTTIPECKVKVGKQKDGRPYAMLSGRVQVGQKQRYFPRFFLSWERRNGKDKEGNDSGQADRSSKNFVMADKAFRTAAGREPSSIGEVIDYLVKFPVRLRIIQLDSGENMVVAISPVIER